MTYAFTSSGRPPTPPFPPGPYGRPSSPYGYGRPRRLASGFVGGLVVGLVELLVFMLIARWLGPGLTVLLMLATSVLGVWLLRREGAKSWRSFRDSLIQGRPPGPSATEGLLVLVGGVLMVLPGFVGDLVGAFLVAPPTRRLAVRWAESALARRLTPAAATSLFGPRTVRVR
ncbi:MAG: FxsA family protein, partial [Dactylosporangium sp.]|nr:FxsA family protein [Dactylosporangium sp.]